MTRRALSLLALLFIPLSAPRAADSSATERLMHMAACIRDAGDMKGAAREVFTKECMARNGSGDAAPPVAKATTKATSESTAEPILPAIPVTPVAPPATPATPDSALPPQERILGCASASKGMQGEARAAYLKACLSGRVSNPAVKAEENKHRAACATQAANEPAEERQTFMAACVARIAVPSARIQTQGVVAPGVINQATVPVLRDDGEARRRAACVVAARDIGGAARQDFIDRCQRAHPAPAAVAPMAATPQMTTATRLVRSKACAEEARSRALVGDEILRFMNACMARAEVGAHN